MPRGYGYGSAVSILGPTLDLSMVLRRWLWKSGVGTCLSTWWTVAIFKNNTGGKNALNMSQQVLLQVLIRQRKYELRNNQPSPAGGCHVVIYTWSASQYTQRESPTMRDADLRNIFTGLRTGAFPAAHGQQLQLHAWLPF
jgi:hypothetical protein